MREWVCINGELVSADEARISVFDAGFMQGVGLFETMRAYRGRVFRLDQHLARLIASARTLGWAVAPALDEMNRSVMIVVGACESGEARVRLTVTSGSLRGTEPETPSFTIVATAMAGGRYPDELYRRGTTAVISNFRHNRSDPTAGHKTTSYFARLASLREAHSAGAIEALWFTHDHVLAEGAISNVFLVDDEELHTPPLETPVLPGITRAAVIEIARELKIPAHQRQISIDDLLGADEVFLTNSMMEIMPVVRIEREAIGNERPGEVTARIAEAYQNLVQRECDDAGEDEE